MDVNNDIKIALLPLDIVWADREANIANVTRTLERLDKDTDLVVLPELFSTGFSADPDLLGELAETNGGPTMAAVRELARRHNVAIAGGFLARTGASLYNRAFFIEPSGDETFYDKRHLFVISAESKFFTPGDKVPPIIRYRGWNFALIVCYDLRFPVWCRNVDNRYDALVSPANWPTARKYAWRHLIIARGIENQAYVVGADRGGSDEYGEYDGMAMSVDYTGKELDAESRDGFIYSRLQRKPLDDFRAKYPFSADGDVFAIDNMIAGPNK